MNQPKFKFGDMVLSQCTKKPFTIDKIEVDKHGNYVYFGKDYVHQDGCGECVLELYQEPQKKKLYAYKVFFTGFEGGKAINGHEIRFFSDLDWSVNFGSNGENDFVRAPEYDITYPEEK